MVAKRLQRSTELTSLTLPQWNPHLCCLNMCHPWNTLLPACIQAEPSCSPWRSKLQSFCSYSISWSFQPCCTAVISRWSLFIERDLLSARVVVGIVIHCTFITYPWHCLWLFIFKVMRINFCFHKKKAYVILYRKKKTRTDRGEACRENRSPPLDTEHLSKHSHKNS